LGKGDFELEVALFAVAEGLGGVAGTRPRHSPAMSIASLKVTSSCPDRGREPDGPSSWPC
jgi:hypothetical protein